MTQKILLIATLFCAFIYIIFTFAICNQSDPLSAKGRYPQAAAQNFDVQQLSQAIDSLAEISGFKSIVVGRNGRIAAEEYYNGGHPDSLHDVRSVTKSVMGLLIGIAIEKGYLQSVDQTIGEFLIDTVIDTLDSARAQISIKHLLMMSCGLEWHELDGGDSYNHWYVSQDHVKWVLEQSFIHEPGNGFNYNTGSTYLLSVILTLTTGNSALEFARQNLLQSMGIQTSDWTFLPLEAVYNNGGAGLSISPHAMFVLGNLMLDNGKYNEIQIVPAEWINQSISIQNIADVENPYGTHYGYLWWVGQARGHNHFYAMGWGGQFIVCVPDFDLVVTATCEWRGVADYDAHQHWLDIFLIIMDEIVTAVYQ